MGKVIGGMTMSLDGFVNDRNGSVGLLYPDFDELHGTVMMQESIHLGPKARKLEKTRLVESSCGRTDITFKVSM